MLRQRLPNHHPQDYFQGVKQDEIETVEAKITAEATPAYILKIEAPFVIHKVLPHTRMILILRNPVDRAYSEYQMKYRCVASQRWCASNTQ